MGVKLDKFDQWSRWPAIRYEAVDAIQRADWPQAHTGNWRAKQYASGRRHEYGKVRYKLVDRRARIPLPHAREIARLSANLA
jgi:hypothetical protein